MTNLHLRNGWKGAERNYPGYKVMRPAMEPMTIGAGRMNNETKANVKINEIGYGLEGLFITEGSSVPVTMVTFDEPAR